VRLCFLKDRMLSVFICILFLSMSDLFIYITTYFYMVGFFVVLLSFVIVKLKNNQLNYPYVLYFICILFIQLASLIDYEWLSFLLFVPLFSYMSFSSFLKNNYRCVEVFSKAVWFSLLIFITISLVELMVKLSIIEFPLYKDFILDYGDGRLDVLRVRSIYGSSLSAAALSIFFIIYYSFFNVSRMGLLLSVLGMLLTGSRTAFVLMCIVFLSVVIVNFKSNIRSFIAGKVVLVVIFSTSVFVFLLYFGLEDLFMRSITISFDQSFLGREGTSIKTLFLLFDDLPSSLVFGLETHWVSDSALVSIAAKNGIIPLLLFLIIILHQLFMLNVISFYKMVVVLIFLLGSMMIGDFFVPSVTFLYITTFLVYKNVSSGSVVEYEHSKNKHGFKES